MSVSYARSVASLQPTAAKVAGQSRACPRCPSGAGSPPPRKTAISWQGSAQCCECFAMTMRNRFLDAATHCGLIKYSKVMLAYDGSPATAALLHMIKDGGALTYAIDDPRLQPAEVPEGGTEPEASATQAVYPECTRRNGMSTSAPEEAFLSVDPLTNAGLASSILSPCFPFQWPAPDSAASASSASASLPSSPPSSTLPSLPLPVDAPQSPGAGAAAFNELSLAIRRRDIDSNKTRFAFPLRLLTVTVDDTASYLPPGLLADGLRSTGDCRQRDWAGAVNAEYRRHHEPAFADLPPTAAVEEDTVLLPAVKLVRWCRSPDPATVPSESSESSEHESVASPSSSQSPPIPPAVLPIASPSSLVPVLVLGLESVIPPALVLRSQLPPSSDSAAKAAVIEEDRELVRALYGPQALPHPSAAATAAAAPCFDALLASVSSDLPLPSSLLALPQSPSPHAPQWALHALQRRRRLALAHLFSVLPSPDARAALRSQLRGRVLRRAALALGCDVVLTGQTLTSAAVGVFSDLVAGRGAGAPGRAGPWELRRVPVPAPLATAPLATIPLPATPLVAAAAPSARTHLPWVREVRLLQDLLAKPVAFYAHFLRLPTAPPKGESVRGLLLAGIAADLTDAAAAAASTVPRVSRRRFPGVGACSPSAAALTESFLVALQAGIDATLPNVVRTAAKITALAESAAARGAHAEENSNNDDYDDDDEGGEGGRGGCGAPIPAPVPAPASSSSSSSSCSVNDNKSACCGGGCGTTTEAKSPQQKLGRAARRDAAAKASGKGCGDEGLCAAGADQGNCGHAAKAVPQKGGQKGGIPKKAGVSKSKTGGQHQPLSARLPAPWDSSPAAAAAEACSLLPRLCLLCGEERHQLQAPLAAELAEVAAIKRGDTAVFSQSAATAAAPAAAPTGAIPASMTAAAQAMTASERAAAGWSKRLCVPCAAVAADAGKPLAQLLVYHLTLNGE